MGEVPEDLMLGRGVTSRQPTAGLVGFRSPPKWFCLASELDGNPGSIGS